MAAGGARERSAREPPLSPKQEAGRKRQTPARMSAAKALLLVAGAHALSGMRGALRPCAARAAHAYCVERNGGVVNGGALTKREETTPWTLVDGFARSLALSDPLGPDKRKSGGDLSDRTQVDNAIRRLQRDMESLDNLAGAMPQLTATELTLLSSTVLIAFSAPYALGYKLVEVLVPSMAALSAAAGISAEYVGRAAVARGKEIASTTLQAAAESEQVLAQAERAKAIIPLCVGVAATASAFALLAPALLEEVAGKLGVGLVIEFYIVSPLLGVLAASVAALAEQESSSLCRRASDIGLRRFAGADNVGRTWLSATEQIESSTLNQQAKWASFSLSVLPAPLLAAIVPGPLSFKAIVALNLP